MHFKILLAFLIVTPFFTSNHSHAENNDPCGMVPPIYTGQGNPISRIGLQQTYVFHKNGVETFIIRPGFTGKVDEFGMLIPFPNAPEIRKVADDIFPHVAAAVDPPEVVMYVGRWGMENNFFSVDSQAPMQQSLRIQKNEVRVVKQEAVGMYEVAVLEAGSAAALKKWIDEHGFRYPDGMDKVANEYIKDQWCFVAVKTKVGQKAGVNPTAGQKKVDAKMPANSSFDGHVQAMGFRFKSKDLVVPMRLSAFNEGDMRNVVYLLTDSPRKIRAIPEEYVQRQISGKQLIKNVTEPLPLRLIGGTFKDIQPWQRKNLPQQRNPEPKNGFAKQVFAADLLAVSQGQLSMPHEETEKELLRLGEHFDLRGPQIDAANADALKTETDKVVKAGLKMLADMTLTVVDGDFPREVLAKQNLTFAEYKMPARRNSPKNYDSKINSPAPAKQGILKLGAIDWSIYDQPDSNAPVGTALGHNNSIASLLAAAIMFIGFSMVWFRRRTIATQ
jgi:hypothetical protein